MPSTGYIQVRAYASRAAIPLENVAITVTAPDGTALAMRLTNRSGKIIPIEIPVPDKEESLHPDPNAPPFAAVNLYARLHGYGQIEIENLQVFSGVVTVQNLELIPLSEMPGAWNETVLFPTPPQNL